MAKSKRFMVVLIGDFSQRLKIPQNYLKHIEEDLRKLENGPKTIKLADTTGRTWCVSIERDSYGTHFTSGWPKFAQEHDLKENECLVFQYDGNQQFSVVIFDNTLCEREIIDEEVAKRSPKVVSLFESDSERSKSRGNDEDMTKKDEEDEEDNSEDYESDSSFVNKSRKKGTVFSRKRFVSCRRAVTDLEKQKAADAAFSFSSKYPHFMIRMSTNMVYSWSQLRFPSRFSKDYLPQEKTEFVLRNSVGQKWLSSYCTEGVKPYAKGRISRGWTHFAQDNNLEEGDYCVFELVKNSEFLVHIFRVVEKVVPPVWVPNKRK